jgi:hypothetical protein
MNAVILILFLSHLSHTFLGAGKSLSFIHQEHNSVPGIHGWMCGWMDAWMHGWMDERNRYQVDR